MTRLVLGTGGLSMGPSLRWGDGFAGSGAVAP
jgi:hypothetical protein